MGKGLIWSRLIFKVGLKLIQKMNNYDGFDYFYSEMQYTSCIIETLSGGIIHYIIQEVMIIWFFMMGKRINMDSHYLWFCA